MNVAEVKLCTKYNFYHDPLPGECRLVYEPLNRLLHRVKSILDEFDSPILNDALFLTNYILSTSFPKVTPLMKLLTGLEILLYKLEEWEVYACRGINSCDNEMNLIKQLIIRYRKIQILSWRNLLNWKRQKLIRDDFENLVRLAHTVER